jgi:uncharacterized membrane protein
MQRLQPLYSEKLIYNLRGGFLVRPLAIALTLGLLGGILPKIEGQLPELQAFVAERLFPAQFDQTVIQTILSTIAEAVMTVVSIVFAILLMSLTLASMQFSPRIISSFTKDRVTQWTLGIFLGTFSYCVCALTFAPTFPGRFPPVLTVYGATLLALMSVAWLLFFIHHISQAISVNFMVDRIAMETEQVIDFVAPRPRNDKPPLPSDATADPTTGAPIVCPISGYVRYVDHSRLVRAAVVHRVILTVKRRVGHFVPNGIELISVSPPERLTDQLAADVLASFDIGPSRQLQQDVEFGILQIVDIALRAISPAVNDPSTAICCIDQLGRILIWYASREPQPSRYYHPPGKLRVVTPVLGFERLVHSAFDQIRSYSKGDLAVCLRMMRALTDISTTLQDSQSRRVLLTLGNRIVAGAKATQEHDDLGELLSRLALLHELAA